MTRLRGSLAPVVVSATCPLPPGTACGLPNRVIVSFPDDEDQSL
jgi:hypothetical protein